MNVRMYNIQGEWEETIVKTLSDKHNKILHSLRAIPYDTWLLKHIIILKDLRMKTQQQLLCLYFMLFIVYELLKIFIMHFYANVNTNTVCECVYECILHVRYMYVGRIYECEYEYVYMKLGRNLRMIQIYLIVTDSRRLSGGACA